MQAAHADEMTKLKAQLEQAQAAAARAQHSLDHERVAARTVQQAAVDEARSVASSEASAEAAAQLEAAQAQLADAQATAAAMQAQLAAARAAADNARAAATDAERKAAAAAEAAHAEASNNSDALRQEHAAALEQVQQAFATSMSAQRVAALEYHGQWLAKRVAQLVQVCDALRGQLAAKLGVPPTAVDMHQLAQQPSTAPSGTASQPRRGKRQPTRGGSKQRGGPKAQRASGGAPHASSPEEWLAYVEWGGGAPGAHAANPALPRLSTPQPAGMLPAAPTALPITYYTTRHGGVERKVPNPPATRNPAIAPRPGSLDAASAAAALADAYPLA